MDDGDYDFNHFVNAYIECALWSSNDESDERGGVPFDSNYDEDDIAGEALEKIHKDCAKFIRENAAELETWDAGSAGHDFWLTRNGHGAGFWDRGRGENGKRLTAGAKKFREVNLVLGDDGKIYCE